MATMERGLHLLLFLLIIPTVLRLAQGDPHFKTDNTMNTQWRGVHGIDRESRKVHTNTMNRKQHSGPQSLAARQPWLNDGVPDHVKNLRCRYRERLSRNCHERDRYCHEAPRFSERQRDCSKCVCRPGYLRNSWGDCITQAQCNHCKNRAHLNEDYNLCESRCPLVCHRPIRPYCSGTCYMECACKPGFIRSTPKGMCVPFDSCLPLCPGRNQVFSTCLHNCQEGCRSNKRRVCTPHCAGEGCMCKPGYVVLIADPLVCVRRNACPGKRQYLPYGMVNKG